MRHLPPPWSVLRLPTLACALIALAGPLASLRAAEQTPPPPADKPVPAEKAVPPAADQPSVKNGKDGKPDAGFIAKHESFLKRGKEGPIGVLFLGDSITAGWAGVKPIWDKHYAAYQPANFGIGGDRTQHVLWRIANGELDGIDPKVVVLMIGTNNSGSPAEEILKGDEAIIAQIHAKLPKTKLLLLGIFPRGMDPKDEKVAALRAKLATVNASLAKLDDGKQTRYLDIGPQFLDPAGVLAKDIMPDALHPNGKGYEIWATAMQPLLDELMKP